MTAKWGFRMEGETGILTTPQGERSVHSKQEGEELMRMFNSVETSNREQDEMVMATEALIASALPSTGKPAARPIATKPAVRQNETPPQLAQHGKRR